MPKLTENLVFKADYERLKNVSMNPKRHTAANAHKHCEMVRARVLTLARLNNCSSEETALLEDLAYVHDIGKIKGISNPSGSVSLLSGYGVTDMGGRKPENETCGDVSFLRRLRRNNRVRIIH